MTHALKTHPQFFKEVEAGNKPFELRKNDRNFKAGDALLLQEWNPETKLYTGKELQKTITYVLDTQGKFGLRKGYVILSLKNAE